MAAGKFKDEIVPVEIKSRKKTVVFDTDEGPRAGTTAEGLSALKCCSGKEGGLVTAGNASGINDGAAAIVVMSEEKAKELGVTAEYVSMLLNGHRSPPNAETRCREALARLIARQQKDSA